jgi:hypothetical protein
MNMNTFLRIEEIEVGQVWSRCDGASDQVTITEVKKLGDGNTRFDYQVYYKYSDGKVYDKDAWNFQVKYYLKKD